MDYSVGKGVVMRRTFPNIRGRTRRHFGRGERVGSDWRLDRRGDRNLHFKNGTIRPNSIIRRGAQV